MLKDYLPWLRLVVALDRVALPWFKDILHDKLNAPEDASDLYKYLQDYKAGFKEQNINFQQERKLFPKDKIKTDETIFDVTLYGFIIKVIAVCQNESIQDRVINQLLEKRNELLHMGNKIMSEQAFNNEWKKMTIFFRENKFNLDRISSLKTDPLLSQKYVDMVFLFLIEGNVWFLVFKLVCSSKT